MAKKLGPRCIVRVGTHKKTKKALYSYMLESTAKFYGFKIEKKIPQTKGKGGRVTSQRGVQAGSGSIQVPTGKIIRKGKITYEKMKQIPIPGSMDIAQIQEFLKKAINNKPKSFRTKDGVTYPVTQ